VMFGEIRRYRGGGEVHMDIMFDGLEVRLPGRSDPITMGVTAVTARKSTDLAVGGSA